MKKFLEEVEKNPQLKQEIKHSVYMNRIQKRIEKEMDNMLWLAVNYPKILLDDEKEYKDETGKIVCHRRLKKLLLTIKAVNPKMEVELVLKNLDFPEKQDAPKEDYDRLLNTCQRCGLPPDLCTCKDEDKSRKTVMPRPTN